jgi:uncharacterized repeat protein (TIGR01451 family)
MGTLRTGRVRTGVAAALLSLAASVPDARAAVASGFQEYYVLGRESHVYNMMQRVATGEGAALGANATHSVVSAVATANGQRIYYDHWEDGLDPDLNSSDPAFPSASQATTLVFGDANPGNGDACAFTTMPCSNDTITDGMALTLESASIPLPRNPAQFFFDGGDRIVTSGGPLALIHNQDPLATIIGGAVEVLSRQAYANATSYSIPAGEDLYAGNGSPTEIFQYVDIDIVAFQDNTQVTITSPGATGGTVSFTLNQGQHYTNRNCTTAPAASACPNGMIDETSAGVPFIRINSGTKISTTGPLAGLIHTGGDGQYATDIFPILPDLLHGSDYLIPSPGDNAGVNGSRPMNLYIFNPDPLNAVYVTATDSAGSFAVNVAANTTIDYFAASAAATGTGRFVPANSTVRLTAGCSAGTAGCPGGGGRAGNFWGLTAHDHQTNIADWGYAWLATQFLTTSYTVPYAPGTFSTATPPCTGACTDSPNRSPVFVGATQDNTLVKIDLDNDGVFDLVDLNSDDVPDNGDFTDATCATPATPCVYRIDAPNALGNRMSLRVFDHTDYDNTGTQIVANKPVAVVYGQDTDQGVPSDLTPDTGYTVYPALQSFLDPVLTIDKTASPTSVSGVTGGNVTFTLLVKAYDFGPLTSLRIFDDLPAALGCGSYVSGSSTVTYPGTGQDTTDPSCGQTFVVTSLTEAGNVASAVTATPHNFVTGDSVTISGASPAGYNGTFNVTVTGATTFTYPVTGPLAAGSGAILASLSRSRLTWTLSPDSLSQNQTLAVEFDLAFPAGAAATFVNGATARASLGASLFEATADASVVRTAVTLSKSVSNAAPLQNEVITYTIAVANNGTAPETAVRVSDLVPANTTFVPGSITQTGTPAGEFAAGTYNAAQNSVVWNAASFSAGGTATLSFQVRVNPGTANGTVIGNAAGYESAQTPYFTTSPPVLATVVGPALEISKSGPTALSTGAVATFDIVVRNTGTAAATNVLIDDPFPPNATYLSESMRWRLGAGSFVVLTDAAADDEGTELASSLQFSLASLAVGQEITFRFQVTATGATGTFVSNQATVSSSEVAAADTNLVQAEITNTIVVGRVFLDLNGNGTQQAGEPGIANVDVVVTDSVGTVQTVTTDAAGNFSATVEPGSTDVNVDESDPDFPTGATLSPPPSTDPQTVNAVVNTTTTATFTGYTPPPLTFTKASDATSGLVVPGQTINYTLTLRNNTTVTQTSIVLGDTLPSGLSYVAGSASVNLPTFRITEYQVGAGSCGGGPFTGLDCDLTLNQDLEPNYFVIVQGADGSAAGTDASTPSQNYAALTRDPFATGNGGAVPGLTASGAANRIRISRRGASAGALTGWQGVVTVVECVRDCAASGFQLVDVARVDHSGIGPVLNGAVTTDNAATDASRVQLVAGVNGAGCDTDEATIGDHKICHIRYASTGANTFDWFRSNAGAGAFGNADSTVMVVQWGSEWTVQSVQVAGNNGGNGVNAAAEYDTTAIAPVVRDNTWVWGSGFTDDNGVGDAAEGVVITLGNGVTQNATEATVAVGMEFTDNKDFQVWTLTHPSLRTDYRFKPDGSSAVLTFNQTVDFALGARMAIVYNGSDGTGTEYPRPIFSARYLNAGQVQLARRRTGASFPAWVQGIDFSRIIVPSGGPVGAPPNLLTGGEGYALAAGETLTITYQATVNDPLATGINTLTNSATADTFEQGVVNASHTLLVPVVDVDPNNAAVGTPNSTLTFTQTVVNRSAMSDSYSLTLRSERGWLVELLDAATGAVIATDSNGDGVWDGGASVGTGVLAAGASKTYRIRVTIPAGTPAGTQDTVRLTATSATVPSVSDTGTNEVTVFTPSGGPEIVLVPDNSGVVTAGSYVAYTHRVYNFTGASDTIDLFSISTQGWTTTVHADSNADGVYTPGTDLQITSTAALANGSSQLLFVVVNAPGGTPAGTADVTHLTATSRNNTNLFDSVTDTTTVVSASSHDLSGGGTELVNAGDTAVFPGTLYNLGPNATNFTFTLSQSSLYGLDAFTHPTEIWVDTNADGVPDTLLAADSDGDGSFDVGTPTLSVPGDAALAYELRRAVDPAQGISGEYVTLTAQSASTGELDSVTAQVILAAATRAAIRGVRIDPAGSVEFATVMQRGTASFSLFEADSPRRGSERFPLHDRLVLSPVADASTPILYRVSTRPITRPFVFIQERETDGDLLWKGPFRVGDAKLARTVERLAAWLDAAGVPAGDVRMARGHSLRRLAQIERSPVRERHERWKKLRRRPAREGVKIEVSERGQAFVPLAELEAAGAPASRSRYRLFNQGRAVPFTLAADSSGAPSLAFTAEKLSTDYTGTNVYVLTWGAKPYGMSVGLTRSAAPPAAGFTRVETNAVYLSGAHESADPWHWDWLFGDGSQWPYDWWWPEAGTFDLPDLAPGAFGDVPVQVRLLGYTDHRHTVEARLNGHLVGSLTFEGAVPATLSGSVPAESLLSTGNQLTLTYVSAAAGSGDPDASGLAYLDYVDIAAPMSASPRAVSADAVSGYAPQLPDFRRVQYLIVTHPTFREAADRIAALKESEGLRSAVVETDDIYDRSSGGIVEARAIQELIRQASRRSGALRYVLLVGDDSFDPQDYLGFGAVSFVPSLLARDSGQGRIPSENLYADTNGDGSPELAIGRLPVQSLEQALALTDKIAGQTEALRASLGRHLFVSDNSGELDAPFSQEAQRTAAALPAGAAVSFADLTDGADAARAAIESAWTAGAMITHYFGHGGPEIWADEDLLSVDDVPALDSWARPTLLLAWACQSNYYPNLWGPSINEALFLLPSGGAVASFGPVGITPPATQKLLYTKVYADLLGSGESVGETIRRAKAALARERPNAREVIDGFHLLGDPALRLPAQP